MTNSLKGKSRPLYSGTGEIFPTLSEYEDAYIKKTSTLLQKYPDKENYINGFSTNIDARNVNRMLFEHKAPFDGFNDLDFLKLLFYPKLIFPTIEYECFEDIFETMNSQKVGRFFTILSERYFAMWNEYSEVRSEIEFGIVQRFSQYGDWIVDTKQERNDVFYSFLTYNKENPKTPIEILDELL